VAALPRILLVEDDPWLREAMAEVLAERGYEVACAAHGREALNELGDLPTPSVILLDLAMPVMDGWEFRAEQRRDPRLAAIPIVVLSASIGVDAHAVERLSPAATLTKPFDLERLLEAIEFARAGVVASPSELARPEAAPRGAPQSPPQGASGPP
jgi:CheY-like chemotaxis protein